MYVPNNSENKKNKNNTTTRHERRLFISNNFKTVRKCIHYSSAQNCVKKNKKPIDCGNYSLIIKKSTFRFFLQNKKNILKHRNGLKLKEYKCSNLKKILFFGHAMHFPTLKLNIQHGRILSLI